MISFKSFLSKLQRGFTLVEISIVIAIMGVILATIAKISDDIAEKNFGKQAGSQLKEMIGAGSAYMAANFEALVNGTPISGVANTMAPTFDELKTLGYINPSTPPVSEFGSTWNFKLSRQPATCTPPACDLMVTVNTTSPVSYKGKINYAVLKYIANEVGNDASYSTDIDPANIHGMNDSWVIPNPASAVPGIVMARAGFGSQGFSQFVRNGDSRNISINGGLTVNGASGVNVTSANGLTATKIASSGNLTVGGSATVNGTTTATGGITVSGSGVNTNSIAATVSSLGTATATSVTASNMQATGTATLANLNAGTASLGNTTATNVSTNTINLALGQTPGSGPCSPDGKTAVDASGALFTCRSGTWVSSAIKPCVHGSWSGSATSGTLLIPSGCTSFTIVRAIAGGGNGGAGGVMMPDYYYSTCWGPGITYYSSGGGGGGGGGAGNMVVNQTVTIPDTGIILNYSVGNIGQPTSVSSAMGTHIFVAAGTNGGNGQNGNNLLSGPLLPPYTGAYGGSGGSLFGMNGGMSGKGCEIGCARRSCTPVSTCTAGTRLGGAGGKGGASPWGGYGAGGNGGRGQGIDGPQMPGSPGTAGYLEISW